LLRAGELLDAAALDKYSFTRDAYLQRRRARIFGPRTDVILDEERYDLPAPSKAVYPASTNQDALPSGNKTTP
jgi:phospholipid-binding lipoprotein MlaA